MLKARSRSTKMYQKVLSQLNNVKKYTSIKKIKKTLKKTNKNNDMIKDESD